MVKNPPAKAGNIDLTPGLRRSPLPQCNWAHMPQLLSLFSRTREPQLLKPLSPRDLAPQQEKPPQREARAPQLENTPACRSEDPAQPKVNKFFFKKGKNTTRLTGLTRGPGLIQSVSSSPPPLYVDPLSGVRKVMSPPGTAVTWQRFSKAKVNLSQHPLIV